MFNKTRENSADIGSGGLASRLGSIPNLTPTTFKELKTVDVEIGWSPLMDDYCIELYRQFVDTISPAVISFTEDEFSEYLRGLLVERVRYVRRNAINEKVSVTVRPQQAMLIPSMFSVILEMIGYATDTATGFSLIPKLSKDLDSFVPDVNMMDLMSRKLALFKLKHGFVFSEGYTKAQDGDFDFMSFEVIEEAVYHLRDDKPQAYAVVAAMLSITGLQKIYNVVAYNAHYGRCVDKTPMVRHLAASRSDV